MLSLVTGGAGFIGSNLVDKLIENKTDVIVIDNLMNGDISNVNKKAHFIKQDIRNDLLDNSILRQLKPDVIYHLAAISKAQPSHLTIDVNSQGTVQVLEYAKSIKSTIVYAGFSSFYGDKYKNIYLFSKCIGEEYCKLYSQLYGVKVSIARLYNVYGPRHYTVGHDASVIGIFERQKKLGEPLTIKGTGEQKRDFCHVEDICSGLIQISKVQNSNCGTYDLGSGVIYSINEIANMFEPNCLKYTPACDNEVFQVSANLETTKSVLKWSPQYKLNDYIKEQICRNP